MGRTACFAPVVAAAERTPALELFPQSVLAALLEDPTPIFVGRQQSADTAYQEVAVEWQPHPDVPLQACGQIGTVLHEASQPFRRPLSFGRLRTFRLHRFSLQGQEVEATMRELSEFASSHAKLRKSASVGEEAVRGSNLRGFQDIVSAEQPLMAALRALFTDCVRRAAAADTAEVTAAGEMTPPPSPRCSDEDFCAWMNVSGKGAMNILHNHGTNAYGAVLYTQVPAQEGGQVACDRGALLLRLSRGSGARFMEPDEDLHVPRMGNGNADGVGSVGTESEETGVVRYVRVQPHTGSLMVFPGWLPHSVTPHFEDSDRVCYASNWS
ncbi:unnamed protein product [Prorocentrum cordatum]|uniref:Uncharacterized protein n=1 Tax=Prorocentrum cordatum TaxID=2364126 RepID=A0ABN9P7H8_9DINO|nr:unnamed protein product [Polarella glacialis]